MCIEVNGVLRQQHLCHFLFLMWTMAAKCHKSTSPFFKSRAGAGGSWFHIQIGVPELNHCYCVAWKTQNGHATRYTINPGALTPDLTHHSLVGACHLWADILFTVWSSAAAPEWRVWFSPVASYHGGGCCSCIPQEWVTGRSRKANELHLFSFCALARLVHTVDRRF